VKLVSLANAEVCARQP